MNNLLKLRTPCYNKTGREGTLEKPVKQWGELSSRRIITIGLLEALTASEQGV